MRELAQRFVPVADEVWKLQRGRDAEARFFQAFADRARELASRYGEAFEPPQLLLDMAAEGSTCE